MKYSVLPADSYVVINKTILNDQDRNILFQLYQPIIGGIAINLYFTLWSNLDRNNIISNNYTHHYLMSIIRLKLEDIIEAREKLEAIGLLCTYVKKGTINEYIYELYSPLNPNDFINNPILGTTLYNHVGEKEYNKIVEMYKEFKFDLKEYENVTSKFSDVFEIEDNFIEVSDIKKRNSIEIDVNSNLDLQNVLSLIPDEVLDKNISNETRELIYKLNFIYNFSDKELSNIIRNSIGLKRTINNDLLREHAKTYYSFEHFGKLPDIVYKNQPEYLRTKITNTSTKSKKIHEYETISPYEFLISKNDSERLNISEVTILEMLLMDYNLKPGVVNVLLDYVLKINDNKLVKNFIAVIASEWKRKKIETVEGAMEQAKLEQKSNKKAKQIPKWIGKENKSEMASKEEIEELENLMKQV